MAGFASAFVLRVKLAVTFIYPGAVVDIVQAMRAIGGQLKAPTHVADRTVADLPGEALEGLGCHIIVGSIIGN